MGTPALESGNIKAILFDMNGTLRRRIPDEDWQQRSVKELLTMLGRPDAPPSFLEELNGRYKLYTQWAQKHEVGLSEAEVWTGWLVPELPVDLIAPQAAELMVVWRNCKGRTILKPETRKVVGELRHRGYRLGLISNTTSSQDIPRFLDECGLRDEFEVVILSAVSGHRKPDPQIFWEATRLMRLNPRYCAYLGNKVANDVVGPRKAGFVMTVIIETASNPLPSDMHPDEKPDVVIHDLLEVLEIFPSQAPKPIISGNSGEKVSSIN